MTNNGPDQKKNQLEQDSEQVAEQTAKQDAEQATSKATEQTPEQTAEQAAERKGIFYGLVVGAFFVLLFWVLNFEWKDVFWTSEAITGLFAVEATAANAVKAIWWATVNDRENKKTTKGALDAFVPSMSAVSGIVSLLFPLGWLGIVVVIVIALIVAIAACIFQSRIRESAILSKSATPDASAA